MKKELVAPFIIGAQSVLGTVLGSLPQTGTVEYQSNSATSKQINVLCEVSGAVTGHLMYGMTLTTGDRIASAMTGQTIRTFDALAASAVAELANMITGTGLQGLYNSGHVCDISPPLIVRGPQIAVQPLSVPALVVPFITEYGEFFVTIGLETA
jgi:chemotaxis protein CheX